MKPIIFISLFAILLASLACDAATDTPVAISQNGISTIIAATFAAAQQSTQSAAPVSAATVAPVPVSTSTKTVALPPAQPSQFKVGDTAILGTLAITVNNVTYPQPTDMFKPNNGNKFLVVDVTIQNNGSTDYDISSMLNFYVKDVTGQKYPEDMLASSASNGTPPDGSISASDKLRGQVGFQIPVAATGLTFVFDDSILGNGKVTFILQ